MKIRTLGAEEGVGMTESQARRFLAESRLVIRIGTVDDKGEPYVHPVWYFFDPNLSKLYIFTGKNSRKLRNIKNRPSVYFEVDDVVWPYKGVRGKGIAREVTSRKNTVALVDKILTKYVKRRNHPIFTDHMSGAKKGVYSVFEITPYYFSTWDYSKIGAEYLGDALK